MIEIAVIDAWVPYDDARIDAIPKNRAQPNITSGPVRKSANCQNPDYPETEHFLSRTPDFWK